MICRAPDRDCAVAARLVQIAYRNELSLIASTPAPSLYGFELPSGRKVRRMGTTKQGTSDLEFQLLKSALKTGALTGR